MGTNYNCSCINSKDSKAGDIPVESPEVETTKLKPDKNTGSRRNLRIRSICMPQESGYQQSGENLLNHINHNQKPLYPLQLRKTHSASDKGVASHIENGITQEENKDESKKQSNDEIDSSHHPIVEDNPSYVGHVITLEEDKIIRKALINHFVFKDIGKEVMLMVVNELIFFSFEKNKIIYQEGDKGNYFYIIAEGKVEVTEKNKPPRKYTEGDCFGELSLLSQCLRVETVKCLTNVSVFSLDGEAFRDIQKRMNESRLKERYDFLNLILLFVHLDNISKYNVANKMKMREFQSFDKIISQGDKGDTLYIIKDGLVSCRIGFKEVRKLGNNDYFGQNAILIDTKRGLDIFALQKTICYEVSKSELIEALGDNYIDVILFAFFRHCIEGNDYFKDIVIDSLMQEVFKCFSIRTYSQNERINNVKFQNNKRVIIVLEGSLYREKSFELVGEKGSILGDYIFKDYAKELPDDVIAYPDCIAFEANVDALAYKMKVDLTNNKPLNLLNRIGKLKKLSLFKHLSDCTLERIAARMKKHIFEAQDLIVEEGAIGDTFFLISKGRVRVSCNNKILRDLESGSCFGEIALLANEEKRTATVTALEKVICYVISKSDFDIIIDDNTIKDYLLKKHSLQDTSITIKDLNYIKFLGKGKFGNVSLVHNFKNIYAIKAVSRRLVDKQKILAKYFVNERRVMLSLDHPFVLKMVKSLKNTHFCFFLIEFINGKNLDEYLSSRPNKRNIEETKFYISSMLLMLDYLQKKYIAHRDIKPSNIMVDSNGYLKMIDFGTAKMLTNYTSTIIGTPHYIAPEILEGKGYALSCDYWSVGICMFEIFYGMYPFGNYANEVVEIYKDILHKEFVFPSDNENYYHLNSFIKELLEKKVNRRNCHSTLLKNCPFFENFEWDKLIEFQMKPPFIPSTVDMSEYLKDTNPYELMVSQDNYQSSKKDKDDYIPPGYDRAWADEF